MRHDAVLINVVDGQNTPANRGTNHGHLS
jgi:hypothetical protein